MKIAMSDKIKHRLVGLAVLVSLGVIFSPVIIKKSQIHQQMMRVHMSIPKKPEWPKVAIPSPSEVFKQVRVADAALPLKKEKIKQTELSKKVLPVAQRKEPPVPIVIHPTTRPLPKVNEKNALADQHKLLEQKIAVQNPQKSIIPPPPPRSHAERKPVQHVAVLEKSKQITKTSPQLNQKAQVQGAIAKPLNQNIKGSYSIQLAYFTQASNANILIKQLKTKGYAARLSVIKNQRGVFYRVLVDVSPNKHQAEMMQKKLAEAVNLQGYIVKVG